MATMKEIRTQFSLDAAGFKKELQNIDKSVKAIDKEFKAIDKDAQTVLKDFKALENQLKALNTQLKQTGQSNKDFAEMVKLNKELSNQLKNVQQDLRTINSVTKSNARSMKDMTEIDLRSISRFKQNIDSIKRVEGIKVFDELNIQKFNELAERVKTGFEAINLDFNTDDAISKMNDLGNKMMDLSSKAIEVGFSGGLENAFRNFNSQVASQAGGGAFGILGGAAAGALTAKMVSGNSNSNSNSNSNPGFFSRIAQSYKAMTEEARKERDIRKTTSEIVKEVASDLSNAVRTQVRLTNSLGGENVEEQLRNQEAYNRELQKSYDIHKRMVETLVREAQVVANNRREQERLNAEVRQQSRALPRTVNRGQAGTRIPFSPRPVNHGATGFNPNILLNSGSMLGRMSEGISGGMGQATAVAGRLAGALGRLGPVAAGLAATFGVYLIALGASTAAMKKSIDAAVEYNTAIGQFSAATSTTTAEVDAFGKSLTDAFAKQGYTDSIMEFSNALTFVQRNLQMTGAAGEDMANKLLVVAKSTGYEVKEIIYAQSSLMKNMNVDGGKALDMIMGLYKVTGDLKGDLVDTFGEYASQLQKTGVSAEYFYKALAVGSQAGVVTLDKVGDSLKEVQLRLSDPTDQAMLKALNKLKLDWNKLNEAFKSGNGEEAIQTIIAKVNELGDTAEKQNVITALFGGPGEDVGNQWFAMMADAKTTVEDFTGSVNDAQKALDETYQVQMTQLSNSFKDLWATAGKDVLPFIIDLVAGLNQNIGVVKDSVANSLSPAFLDLAQAIAYALGLDKPNDFANGIVDIINWVSDAIQVVSDFTVAFSQVGDVLRIIWNVAQIVLKGIAYIIDGTIYGTLGIVEGLLRTILKGLQDMINGAIEGINSLTNSLPSWVGGGDIIKWRANFVGSGSYGDQWGKDNFWMSTATSVNQSWIDSMGGDIDDIISAGKHFGRGWSQYGKTPFTRKNITPSNNTTKPPVLNTGTPSGGGSTYSGYNQTDEDNKKEQDAQKEAERLAELRKKMQDEVLQSTREYVQHMIDLAKEAQQSTMSIEESLAQQKWSVMGDTPEALQQQFDFYDQVKKKYILTADEIMAYSQKQTEIGVALREKSLEEFKSYLDKEVKAKQEANTKAIESDNLVIKNAQDNINKLQQQFAKDDRTKQMNDLDSQIAKYAKATSTAGIAKYKELLQQKADLQTEIDRDAKIQQQQDVIDAAQNDIDIRQKANDEIEQDYNELYDELENLVGDKEAFLAKLREETADTANANIKAGLEDLKNTYTQAYADIEASMLSMEQVQNAIIDDAQRAWGEAYAVGDTQGMADAHQKAEDARAVLDQIGGKEVDGSTGYVSQRALDYAAFERNGKEWMDLQNQIKANGDKDGSLKAKQDALHAANNALRKKYGVTDMNADLPKYHTGGEVTAKLLQGEAVLSSEKYNKLVNWIDNLTSVPSLAASAAASGNAGAIIGTQIVHNYSNADFRVMQQEMATLAKARNRANGRR